MNNQLEQVLEALKELPTISKHVKELGSQVANLQDQFTEMKGQMAEMKDQLNDQQAQINGLREQGKHILTAVADLQVGQHKLQEEVSAIRGQIAHNAELPTTVEDLNQKVATHESTFDSIHQVLDKQFKAI